MFEYKCRYTDFLNVEREETFRFHLNESEIVDKELTTEGGLQQLLEKMSEKQDVPSLSKFFKEFIQISYGEISPDGRKFNKTKEIWEDFYATNAYNELYMKLLSDSDFANQFIMGVLPKDTKPKGNDRNLEAIERAKAAAAAKVNGMSVVESTSAPSTN